MRKQTNTLSPSPKGFQSPKFSDSDFREVRGLGLGRPKSSAVKQYNFPPANVPQADAVPPDYIVFSNLLLEISSKTNWPGFGQTSKCQTLKNGWGPCDHLSGHVEPSHVNVV
jgi:hypothetical protein